MSDNKIVHRNSDVKDKRYAELRRSGLKKRQRLIISSMTISVLIVIFVFVIGYIIAFVMPPRQLVVRVNDIEYTRGDVLSKRRQNLWVVNLLHQQLFLNLCSKQ